jgi:Gpi18-like mannosyltransferase
MNQGKNFIHPFPKNQWLDSFVRWDSGWYMNIIEKGYSFSAHEQSNVAFFPLYPLLVKVLSTLTGIAPLINGLIISNLSFGLALFFVYKISLLYLDEKSTRRVIILILVYPVSFFFSAFYTEGLYFLTIAASFYFYLKRQYFTAGLWGFLASLTRFSGVLLFISFGIDLLIRYCRYRRLDWSIFYLLLIPCGLLSYMYFLYLKVGNPLSFYLAQANWGRSSNDFFLETILHGLTQLDFIFTSNPLEAIVFLDCLVSILALGIISFCLRRTKLDLCLIVFSVLSILMPLSTGLSISMSRYILPVFPLFILLADLCRNDSVYLPILFAFTYLQAATFLWFAHYGWVA